MFEYDPQPSGAYIVRSETLTGLATRAQRSLTGTIGPRALDHLVMLPHLSFSIRIRQVDAYYQTSYCLGGAGTRCQTALAPLSLRGPADTKKWGRGSRDNLSGRGRWRGTGGVILDKQFETSPTYSGQIICAAADVFVSRSRVYPKILCIWHTADRARWNDRRRRANLGGRCDPLDVNTDTCHGVTGEVLRDFSTAA